MKTITKIDITLTEAEETQAIEEFIQSRKKDIGGFRIVREYKALRNYILDDSEEIAELEKDSLWEKENIEGGLI